MIQARRKNNYSYQALNFHGQGSGQPKKARGQARAGGAHAHYQQPVQDPQQGQGGARPKEEKVFKLTCFFSVIFLMALAISLVGHYNMIIKANEEIVRYERELKELQQEQETIRIEIARLSTLRRVESIAMNELDMCYPNEGKKPDLVAINQ